MFMVYNGKPLGQLVLINNELAKFGYIRLEQVVKEYIVCLGNLVPLLNCVNLGKLLHLSLFLFPHCKNRRNNGKPLFHRVVIKGVSICKTRNT